MQLHLEFYNQQSVHKVDLAQIEHWTHRAQPLVLAVPGPEPTSLLDGLTIEFTLVDDATIAQVHGDFLHDPTPTDVITFHHGEILISTETASRQGSEHGQSLMHELTLYAIHGLLHLHGHEDHTEGGAARMKELQTAILAQILAA